MDTFDCVALGFGRFAALEIKGFERLKHGGEPRGAFRMARHRIVAEHGGMGEEQHESRCSARGTHEKGAEASQLPRLLLTARSSSRGAYTTIWAAWESVAIATGANTAQAAIRA
jgi:hypothetical protein